jgi:hypothetical protein
MSHFRAEVHMTTNTTDECSRDPTKDALRFDPRDAGSLQGDRRRLLERFRYVDLARKAAARSADGTSPAADARAAGPSARRAGLRPTVAMTRAVTLLHSRARRNHRSSNHPFRVTTAHPTQRHAARASQDKLKSARRDQMFTTRSQQSRARAKALEIWRAAAHVVSTRWERFLRAGPEMRVFAFASYVAALDAEEAAAANLAVLARPAAA